MYITSPAVTSPRFDTPPRRSRAQRRHRTAPPATPFVGTVLAALMVSGSFGATLLVDSPAAAYEQGGIDQGETDDGFEQGGVGGGGDDATPPVAPPQQTAPSYNYNPGPGAIPAPPREAPYRPYADPQAYNQPNYDTVYNPARPRAYTLPRPVAPVRPIAPPPKTLRVGNFLVEEDQLKRDAPWLTDRQRVSINEWSAYGEAKIAQGLISVGVPEDEASRQAASTIIGVALGGTAAAAVGALAELVRDLVDTRSLDVEYLLPLVPHLDRDAMLHALPRVVSVLADGSEEHKVAVHRLFQTLVAPAMQAAGAETASEHPTTTASLTPVELLVLLHVHEKEIGLKAALVAVQLCFSMSEVFRSDVLTAVLNRLVEEDPLPVLFMRTAIMATKSFRTLGSYVSTSLLSRLVQKEIWREPRLWDGFALCANLTAPTSFGAMLQLPPPQLLELVTKQPSLRDPLRDYLIYKAGGPVRHGALLQMLESVPTGT